jgi:predicted DsbA family dithiol-disulfide isomerase
MAAIRAILAADFTCPYSYVTEAGLRRVIDPQAELRYLAYELFPAPAPLAVPGDEPGWPAALEPLAAAAGLQLTGRSFVPRTRKAHEAAWLAGNEGLGSQMRDAIYAAYWGEELDIGRIDVLVALGQRIGLEPDSLRIGLDIDAAADAVSAEQAVARKAGIRQTPTLIVGVGEDAIVRVGALSLDELRDLPLRSARGDAPRDPRP